MLLFSLGIISFRAVPRVVKVISDHFGLAWKSYHFTSVINWCLKVGLYKLTHLHPWSIKWTAIIDASIEWGNKKMLVILRVPTLLMSGRSKALGFKDVEVIGLFVKEVINGEIIEDLLKTLFPKFGIPCQILSDGGPDLAKGVRIALESYPSQCVHSLDIGHVAANILKRVYIEDEQFKELLTFATKVSSRLRQTIAAWIIPNKIRTKARFQSLSELAKWAKKSFEYCRNHLADCDQKTRCLLEENFSENEALVKFSERFSTECQAINDVLKVVKNKGLSKATFSKSLKILSRLKSDSEIRLELEEYLTKTLKLMTRHGIHSSIVSTDIIESLFGKIKIIINRSPIKDFNRSSLLIPQIVGELDEQLVTRAIKKIKIKEIQQWDDQNIRETLLRKKRSEFGKLKSDEKNPKHAEYQVQNSE